MSWDVRIYAGNEKTWDVIALDTGPTGELLKGILMGQSFPEDGKIVVTPHPETRNYPCPVEGCDHPPFKTSQARESHIRNKHPDYYDEMKSMREAGFPNELRRALQDCVNFIGDDTEGADIVNRANEILKRTTDV